ncbi:MAG: isoprenylcysteine carboxylmethyltransferase family protein [Bryobacterales bacterium]|nr:isoprenylcysteine carboxylmethyltransferase family protein [Bryobacterales bacterium]MBV9396568.1 isoprenylcysteine carboxylmethyltransferase family protein [Bryobacterales bacterium]
MSRQNHSGFARVSFSKPYADAVAKLRVFCGFLMAAAFVWFSEPTAASLAFGLPLAAAGLALRAWAAGHLEKNLSLTDSGPYAHVRNPLYIGTLTVSAGFAIAARRWELGLLFAAIFLLVYLPVVELEEQHLARLFPEFKEYARRVPRLAPRISGWGLGAKPFQFSLYRRNREYEALAGFLAGVGVLFWKVIR